MEGERGGGTCTSCHSKPQTSRSTLEVDEPYLGAGLKWQNLPISARTLNAEITPQKNAHVNSHSARGSPPKSKQCKKAPT